MKTYSWLKTWRLTKFKNLEIQCEFNNKNLGTEWFVFNLSTRTDCDHAGAVFHFEFLRVVFFCITFYDSRHKEEE